MVTASSRKSVVVHSPPLSINLLRFILTGYGEWQHFSFYFHLRAENGSRFGFIYSNQPKHIISQWKLLEDVDMSPIWATKQITRGPPGVRTDWPGNPDLDRCIILGPTIAWPRNSNVWTISRAMNSERDKISEGYDALIEVEVQRQSYCGSTGSLDGDWEQGRTHWRVNKGNASIDLMRDSRNTCIESTRLEDNFYSETEFQKYRLN